MIYVDPMMLTSPTKDWPYSHSCHMVTDGQIDELHAFAGRLRLKREWFQGQHKNRRYWHYDLTEGKRAQAVRMGAKEITHQQLVQFLQGKPLVIEETQGPQGPGGTVKQAGLWE